MTLVQLLTDSCLQPSEGKSSDLLLLTVQ